MKYKQQYILKILKMKLHAAFELFFVTPAFSYKSYVGHYKTLHW